MQQIADKMRIGVGGGGVNEVLVQNEAYCTLHFLVLANYSRSYEEN